jgi:hypothetical protein
VEIKPMTRILGNRASFAQALACSSSASHKSNLQLVPSRRADRNKPDPQTCSRPAVPAQTRYFAI